MKHNANHLFRIVLTAIVVCGVAGTSYADADKAKPLPLGQMTSKTSVACPAHAAAGAVCTHYVVTGCKDANGNPLEDLGVTLAVTQGQVAPGQSPKGTIILHAGGAATSFFNTVGIAPNTTNFADYYVNQGYNVVQIAWDPGSNKQGWNADGSGNMYHACRGATVFDAIYHDETAHPKHTAFCGQGISGGATILGFAIEHFATSKNPDKTQEKLFDYVLFASGSPVGRADVGCAPQVYNDASIVNCGVTSNANASKGPGPYYEFQGPLATALNTWMGTTTCGSANPSQSDINIWAANSNVSTGPLGHPGVFKYKDTNVSFYFCGVPNNNPSLGLARFMIDATQPKNSPVPVNCFTQCQVEGVWNDPNAVAQTESDMAKFCVNNHQGDDDYDHHDEGDNGHQGE